MCGAALDGDAGAVPAHVRLLPAAAPEPIRI